MFKKAATTNAIEIEIGRLAVSVLKARTPAIIPIHRFRSGSRFCLRNFIISFPFLLMTASGTSVPRFCRFFLGVARDRLALAIRAAHEPCVVGLTFADFGLVATEWAREEFHLLPITAASKLHQLHQPPIRRYPILIRPSI
jgi:hypothetical protein